MDVGCSYRETGVNYIATKNIDHSVVISDKTIVVDNEIIRECLTCYCSQKDVIKWAGPKAREGKIEIASILVCIDCPHRRE